MSTAVFDAVAPTYDAEFTDTRLGRWLRARVWRHLTFAPGSHVLEIGCGTGEDAAWLGRRGVSVLATDVSPAMLTVAAQKTNGLPVAFARQDAANLTVDGIFEGAFANFGVLNCVSDLACLAERLPLRTGGTFVAVVMGPFCLWETAWYALHGDIQRATRRWRPATASIGGADLPLWYPSPRHLTAAFKPRFALRHCEGLGTLLPPSYLSGLVDRWPTAFAWLARHDSRLGTRLADHYVAVFERR
jgi:SAM-dependent methyltransferase